MVGILHCHVSFLGCITRDYEPSLSKSERGHADHYSLLFVLVFRNTQKNAFTKLPKTGWNMHHSTILGSQYLIILNNVGKDSII